MGGGGGAWPRLSLWRLSISRSPQLVRGGHQQQQQLGRGEGAAGRCTACKLSRQSRGAEAAVNYCEKVYKACVKNDKVYFCVAVLRLPCTTLKGRRHGANIAPAPPPMLLVAAAIAASLPEAARIIRTCVPLLPGNPTVCTVGNPEEECSLSRLAVGNALC